MEFDESKKTLAIDEDDLSVPRLKGTFKGREFESRNPSGRPHYKALTATSTTVATYFS